MKNRIKSSLWAVLFFGIWYYTAKFFWVWGSWEGIYEVAKASNPHEISECEQLNMYKYGTKGQCMGMYIPPDDVILEIAIEETFLTFP